MICNCFDTNPAHNHFDCSLCDPVLECHECKFSVMIYGKNGEHRTMALAELELHYKISGHLGDNIQQCPKCHKQMLVDGINNIFRHECGTTFWQDLETGIVTLMGRSKFRKQNN